MLTPRVRGSRLLICGIIPDDIVDDIVASDGNPMLLCKGNHGITNTVMFLSCSVFCTLPFHFIFKCSDGESGGEPILVGSILEDVVVDCRAKWEARPRLGKDDRSIWESIAISIRCTESHKTCSCLQGHGSSHCFLAHELKVSSGDKCMVKFKSFDTGYLCLRFCFIFVTFRMLSDW